MKSKFQLLAALTGVLLVLAAVASTLLVVAPAALAATPGAALPEGATWAFAAAAASTALSALAAGYAVAKVGTAAIGAMAEKPELFGRLLIFVGLAEGIAIYGLIVSILILNRLA
jgi:V/A-type H+-transporting ATPase subunit K